MASLLAWTKCYDTSEEQKSVGKMVVQKPDWRLNERLALLLLNFPLPEHSAHFVSAGSGALNQKCFKRRRKMQVRFLIHGTPLVCLGILIILEKWHNNSHCATVSNSEYCHQKDLFFPSFTGHKNSTVLKQLRSPVPILMDSSDRKSIIGMPGTGVEGMKQSGCIFPT